MSSTGAVDAPRGGEVFLLKILHRQVFAPEPGTFREEETLDRDIIEAVHVRKPDDDGQGRQVERHTLVCGLCRDPSADDDGGEMDDHGNSHDESGELFLARESEGDYPCVTEP